MVVVAKQSSRHNMWTESVHMLCLDDCFATTTMPQPTEITQFIFGQPLSAARANRIPRHTSPPISSGPRAAPDIALRPESYRRHRWRQSAGLAPLPNLAPMRSQGRHAVESECGAVAVGRTYLLPPLSSGGASLGRPWLPFPYPAHRTGHADLPHPALGQDVTPSPTTGRV